MYKVRLAAEVLKGESQWKANEDIEFIFKSLSEALNFMKDALEHPSPENINFKVVISKLEVPEVPDEAV